MNKKLKQLILPGLALAISGCSTGFRQQQIQTALNQAYGPNAPAVQQPAPLMPRRMAQPMPSAQRERQIQQVGYEAPLPLSSEAAGAVRISDEEFRNASHFTPAEPRQACPPTTQPYPTMGVIVGDNETSSAMVHRYPDEYLFDGGDRGQKVHYTSSGRRGVETEDTFVEYTDHTGESHVRESNPVAIYAPRFAAVRTMTGPKQDVTIDRLAMASDANPGAAFVAQEAIATSNRRTKAGGMRTRQRGSEIDTIDAGVALLARSKAAGNVFYLKPLKRGRVQSGAQFERTNEAWLANRVQSAANWSMDAFPHISASTSAAMEAASKFRPQVFVSVDDEVSKGSLRIIKMADRKSAVTGDVITFTIEFENLGDKELYNVRIVDNLTPRLEYIEGSASSDIAGKIIIDDNDHGSKMLTFELQGKIEGRSKAAIEFRARVR